MTTQTTNTNTRLDTDNLFSKTGPALSNLLKAINCNAQSTYIINGADCEIRVRNRLAMLCSDDILDLIKNINADGPKAVIAGGIVNLATDFTLDIFNKQFNKSDIDIFVFGPDKQETVKRILSNFTFMVPPDMCLNIMGPTYVGVCGSVVYIWAHGLSRLIQIVILDDKHQTAEDVLANFDMTHIMCAFDGTDFIVRGAMLEALATRTTIYTRNTPSREIQGLRILKAETRGYNVLMTTKAKPDIKIPIKFDIQLHYVNNQLVQDYMDSGYVTPWKVINGNPDAEIIDYYMKQSKSQTVVKCEIDSLPDIIACINFEGFTNMLAYATTGSSQPDKPPIDNEQPSPESTPAKIQNSADYPVYDLSGKDEPSEDIIRRAQDPEQPVFLKLSKKRWIYNPHMHNVRLAFTIQECDRLRKLFPKIKLDDSYQRNEYIGDLVNIKILYDWYGALAKCTDPETDIYIKFPKKQLFTNQNHTVLEIDERAYKPENRSAESQESKFKEMRDNGYYMGTLGQYKPLNTNPETFKTLWSTHWPDSVLSESYEVRAYLDTPSYKRTELDYKKISTVTTDWYGCIISISKLSYKLVKHGNILFLHVELTDNEAVNLEFIRQQMIEYARTMNIAPGHIGLNIHPVDSMVESNDNVFELDGKKYVKILYGCSDMFNYDRPIRQELPLRFNNYGGKFSAFVQATFLGEFDRYSPIADVTTV